MTCCAEDEDKGQRKGYDGSRAWIKGKAQPWGTESGN